MRKALKTISHDVTVVRLTDLCMCQYLGTNRHVQCNGSLPGPFRPGSAYPSKETKTRRKNNCSRISATRN